MCLEGAAAPACRRSVFGGRGRQETPNPLIPSVPFLRSRDPGVVVAVLGRRHAAEGVVGSVLVVVDQDDAGRRARIRFLPCPYWHVSVPNPHGWNGKRHRPPRLCCAGARRRPWTCTASARLRACGNPNHAGGDEGWRINTRWT